MADSEKYKPFIIKEYPNWTLYLHEKQWPYVGRCYAWWVGGTLDEGQGMSPYHLTGHELVVVNHRIFSDVLAACKALGHTTGAYGTDFLLNMAYLANEEVHGHHMHWHFVPRFKRAVRVEALLGRYFEDLAWGKNWAKIQDIALPHHELMIIRDTMAEAIDGIPAP